MSARTTCGASSTSATRSATRWRPRRTRHAVPAWRGCGVGYARAAMYLGQTTGQVSAEDAVDMLQQIEDYGPIPALDGIPAENLLARLVHDKKTVQGKVHFVLPVRIGEVKVVSGVDEKLVLAAIQAALA